MCVLPSGGNSGESRKRVAKAVRGIGRGSALDRRPPGIHHRRPPSAPPVGAPRSGHPRYVLTHMIEEYACHNGHADFGVVAGAAFTKCSGEGFSESADPFPD
ncbi:DUF664 domain-containing protein [Streptomyces sp. NPDC059474]|uniref:mycothiol transferase n=1 Tax=Streptomyces sp. NPDC059474 TaxID=3346846 RepID=UPI0036A85294